MHAASTLISLAVVTLAIAPVFLLHVLLGLLRAARSILLPGFGQTDEREFSGAASGPFIRIAG